MTKPTELSNVDDLVREIAAARATAEMIDAANAQLKKWARNLPERFAAADWSTEGLEGAVADLADATAALKGSGAVLGKLSAVEREAGHARTVGEAAAAAGARGDLRSFTGEGTSARRARRAAPVPVDAASGPPVAQVGDPVEARVRQAYLDIAREPGQSWISLVSLRAHLAGLDRAEMDAALHRLSREPGVHLQGEANQQTLTPEDWAAGVTFGGSTRHILKIERKGRR